MRLFHDKREFGSEWLGQDLTPDKMLLVRLSGHMDEGKLMVMFNLSVMLKPLYKISSALFDSSRWSALVKSMSLEFFDELESRFSSQVMVRRESQIGVAEDILSKVKSDGYPWATEEFDVHSILQSYIEHHNDKRLKVAILFYLHRFSEAQVVLDQIATDRTNLIAGVQAVKSTLSLDEVEADFVARGFVVSQDFLQTCSKVILEQSLESLDCDIDVV